jgi:very-short-patch-repair endonuclease
MKIHYNPKLKQLSRELRKNSTLAERLLWTKLKARRMNGYQFMRQKPIEEYIVDFFCSKLKLIIEIDGESHAYNEIKDRKRQKKLESLGFTVLRYDDHAVKTEIEGVMNSISYWIRDFENE